MGLPRIHDMGHYWPQYRKGENAYREEKDVFYWKFLSAEVDANDQGVADGEVLYAY